MTSLRIAIILAAVLIFIAPAAAEKRITVVHTNDMHSHLQGFSPELDFRPFAENADRTLGGWSRVATVIRQTQKTRNHPVLVLDAGDFSMGSLFHMLIREEAFELRLLAAMGYNAVTLGNHEFDLKPRGLAAILKTAKDRGGLPPIVAANPVFDRREPALAELEDAFVAAGVKPYLVLERDGLKIGIFGILGRGAVEVSPFAKPLTFRDPIDTARDMVNLLRRQEKADIVICLSHGGLADNPRRSEDLILAKEVPGIDVIVSGHSHTKLDKPLVVGNTLVVQAWCYGKQVGVMDLVWKEGKVALQNYAAVPVTSAIPGDKDIQRMIDGFKRQIDQDLLRPVGMSYDQVLAETRWDLANDAEESPLGNLIADSIRWYVNTTDPAAGDPAARVVVAVESNGIIRDNLLAGTTGKIILGDLFRTFPLGIGADDTMSYPLISFYLYGYEIKRALEILTSVRPFKGDDYFLQISGLRFTYNPRRMIFDRVTGIEIGSEEDGYRPLDYSTANQQLYRVAANIYNAAFLKLVGRFTYGLLEIVPKDRSGRSIAKLSDARVDADPARPGVQELKEWQGLVTYVRSFPDANGNGLADIPDKYRGKLGRIVAKPSFNPVNLVYRPGKPTLIALAVLGGIVLFLAAVAVVIIKRKKLKLKA
ncbi:MAG: bifunctional metallophosphatase/5'-nucleotidase [Syntrophaceae bacterium]|jgi:5'-nucleotidase|nr:bifunctional metallophosphatase/5'-nucleotidase [Syntrophaceae bacterium]